LLQQKTVSAYAVGYFSGVFVVDAHDIALRVNSPGIREDGAGVIDSREFPVFEQIAVRGPRLIYVSPDYRAILIDTAGSGVRGARDIERNEALCFRARSERKRDRAKDHAN
jgi:hypothetical protein